MPDCPHYLPTPDGRGQCAILSSLGWSTLPSGSPCGACKRRWTRNEPPTMDNWKENRFLCQITGGCGPSKPQRTKPCLHLGPVVDRLDCNCQRRWTRRCDLPIVGTTSLNQCDSCPHYDPDDAAEPGPETEPAPPPPATLAAGSMLMRFPHSLGDTAQLTSVLEHLRRLRPALSPIGFVGKTGCHTAIKSYCCETFLLDRGSFIRGRYASDVFVDWYEPDDNYPGLPSTKAEKSLIEQFGVTPKLEWCRTFIDVGDEARRAARAYLESISGAPRADGKFHVVVIHYQGNTSKGRKDLSNETVEIACDVILAAGYVPVILDWSTPFQSSLIDQKRIFCPDVRHPLWMSTGTGDAERITALAEAAALFVGVDSGPLHCAMGSPSAEIIGVWTGHHPLHYANLHDRMIHLVPDGHEAMIRGNREQGLKTFSDLYKSKTYRWVDDALCSVLAERLPLAEVNGFVRARGHLVRKDNLAQDLIVVRDVISHDCYKLTSLAIEPRPELVIDVGAHIGTFAKRYHELNPLAKIICVEACPENIPVLTANVGDFATIVHAACTYEPGELGLLNSVEPHCSSTGGSRVVELRKVARGGRQGEYLRDARPLRKVTIEALIEEHGDGRAEVDLLKLDCEGSELSILQHMTTPVRLIVGEYHDRTRWLRLIRRKFAGWVYEGRETGYSGMFRLRAIDEAARLTTVQ